MLKFFNGSEYTSTLEWCLSSVSTCQKFFGLLSFQNLYCFQGLSCTSQFYCEKCYVCVYVGNCHNFPCICQCFVDSYTYPICYQMNIVLGIGNVQQDFGVKGLPRLQSINLSIFLHIFLCKMRHSLSFFLLHNRTMFTLSKSLIIFLNLYIRSISLLFLSANHESNLAECENFG